MKKILLLLTSITVILTLGACGDNKKETEEKANQTEKESASFLTTISTKDFKQKWPIKQLALFTLGVRPVKIAKHFNLF